MMMEVPCQDGLIVTPDEVFGLAVHTYHKQMLSLLVVLSMKLIQKKTF